MLTAMIPTVLSRWHHLQRFSFLWSGMPYRPTLFPMIVETHLLRLTEVDPTIVNPNRINAAATTNMPEHSNKVSPIFLLQVVCFMVQSTGSGIQRMRRSVDTFNIVEAYTSCILMEHCVGGGGRTCQLWWNGRQPRESVKNMAM